MPRDVQDIAVRNRAVSVYSPTRPIRRPGGFANAGTAQAVMGRGPTQQTQQQPVSPQTTFGAGAAPQTSRLPGWTQALGTGMPAAGAGGVGGTTLDRISARMPQPEQEEPGGFWGSSVGQAIGTVVNNPVGRGIMTALDTLQYPRRIVQSSINEVADAFNAGDVSFDDWTQQIGDEDFGFGHMTPDTGITLLDGLIGFTGDVLLDPLTFVGGAGLWSGIAGKSARAGAAATIEAAGVKVGQLTARETAEQVGRWGFSRFDDAARAELRAQLPNNVAGRILDRGYHFKVPLTQRFIPIPGTGQLDRGVSRGAGRVRDIMTHSPLGDWMRYASTPGGQRDAITTLVTKRPRGGFDFGSAAEFVNFKNGEKLASKSFVTKANQIANVFLREAGGSGPGWQKRGNGTLSDMFRTAETVGGTRAHDFYAAVRKMAQDDFGIRIPEFEGAYLPHMWTERGLSWLNGGTDAANKFKALLYKEVDINDVASVSRQRKLLAGNTYRFGGEKVGDNWVGGHTFTLVDGSADEINKIFRRLVPDADFDLLDTDFASTAHRYIKSLEPQVGVVGGLKKVLGSKSGLIRDPLNGSSLTDLLRAEDLDALASAGTAQVLKTKLRTAVSTVRQVRDDNIRGVSSIGGDLGVQARAALDELATVPHATKVELDDAFTELQRLEELRGVGKYNDRFNVADATTTTTAEARRVGTIHAQFEKVWNGLAKKHRALEKKVAKLKADAAAEARRIEARGGKGATPVMDELRATMAEAGETAIDGVVVGEILRRLELNRAAQATIDARLGDRDFINLAVADNLSPKSPGQPAAPATPAPPAYTGPSPLEVSTDFNGKRLNVLGDDQRSAEIATRFEAQAIRVDRSRRRLWETRTNNTPLIDSTHDAMVNGRRYEAGLKHAVDHSRGKPELLEQHLDYSRRLDDFREGELPRLQAEYADAKRPLDDAENTFKVDEKKLQEIRDEQMALARTLDARRGDTPRLPLTRPQVDELTRQRTRLRRDRGKWLRSPEGKTHVKAQQQLDTLTRNLEDTSSRIERLTSSGGRFYIDADGAVHPKFTTQQRWALDLIDERTNRLIPARNQADARHDAARETWERLSVEGADVTTAELHAARREVDAAYKAWRTAQEAVVDANKKLTGVTDVPDLGRIGADADKLRRLLANQASMKGRLDDLARQTSDSGQQLYRFDDGIAGIDTQLQAQATAARIAAEAPPTPYGAQIAHLNRQELERLDAIEAKFAGYRGTWDDPGELPANPSNLGQFEGQWENNPTIKRAMDVVNRGDRVRTFQAMDTATDLANSQAAVRTAAEPFTIPPKGTPAHTAVMEFSPASRGGAMGAVGRGQAVAAETQRFLDNHVDELVEAGALSREYGDEMFRRRLDLDRALDLHAQNPSAHIKAELEQQASELGRFTEFALRYKAALEGGNEPSNALGAFLLARQLDDEAVSLRRQIDVGNRRLSTSAGGRLELDYSSKLAGLNVQHAQLTHQIEAELAKARSGATWNQQAVDGWTRELDGVQQRIDRLGPPSNGMLDDAVDSHAAFLADDMRSLDDAPAIYAENRIVDHRMQWPVRRRDELMAAIPHRQGEVQAAKMSQRRLEDAIGRARAAPEPTLAPGMVRLYRGDPVKTPMSPEAARAARAARGMDWIDQSPEMLARNQAQGRWFTRDRNLAGTYPTNRDPDELNKIRYVDIPQAEYDRLHGLAGAPPEVRSLSASPEAEVLLPDRYLGQVRDVPGQTVRYTPYNTEGFKGSVAEMPLAQAEANLVHNQQVIDMLEKDLVNKQVQMSVLEGTAQERLALLERELGDVDGLQQGPDQISQRIAGILEDADRGVSKYGPSGEAYNEGLRIVGNHKVRMRRDLSGREVWEVQAPDGTYSTFDNAADLEAFVRQGQPPNMPPNPPALALENNAIRQAAETEQRALSPGELETIASNQARIDRLNRGVPLDGGTVADMQDEAGRLRKAIDDFEQVMGGDAAHAAAARDNGAFINDLVRSGRVLSSRDQAMLRDIVGPETAAAAETWIHFLDEAFAGKAVASGDEFVTVIDDMTRTFGDNELVDRLRERAIASLADDTVSFDEMRDELSAALLASANRQRGEAIRETTSMQALFGTSFVDGPGGLRPRFAAAAADDPSHQLLTARLRVETLEAMKAKGYDPRNAMVDEVADLRTRLGRVETMRRGVDDVVNRPGVKPAALVEPPPVKSGFVRLWRGAPPEGQMGTGFVGEYDDIISTTRAATDSKWFTPDRSYSRAYMGTSADPNDVSQGRQFYVDIPEAEYDRIAGLAGQPEEVFQSALPKGLRDMQHLLGREETLRRAGVDINREVILPDKYLSNVTEVANTLDVDKLRLAIANNLTPEWGEPLEHAVMQMDDVAVMRYFDEVKDRLPADMSEWVGRYGDRVPGRIGTAAETSGNAEWMDVLFTGTPSAQARRQVRETLEAGGEALRVEEQQLVGQVDAARQARMAEELKVLDNRVAEKMEPLQTEMNRLQQAADQAERTHNARLRELDMSIATARERVMQASRSYEEFEQFRGQLERTIANNPSKDTESLRGLIDDMRWVDAARRGGPSDPFDAAAITQTEALLTAATEETLKIDAAKVDAATYSAAFREAQRNGKQVAEAVEGILKDGWRIMAKGQILDNPEGVLVANQLADAIENVVPWVQKSAFWQFIDRYTAFFKTYATAKPGFHVRNALSATFMNMVDGVRLRDMYQGARLWRQFERDPNFWMKAGVDPKIRDAFHAAFASGAGGAYGEFSLEVAQTAQTGVTRALESTYRRVMNNALTRWNRRLGSRVEGSARLAMALNTTLVRGGSVEDALRRVTKFHFDYSEISDFDRYARRLVPFWTFMSRNLPLQLEQMFINPRAYQQYNSLVRNFGQTLDPYTPDYWISQGAFTVDEHAADRESPWYIAPDLPHLRVTEPLDAAVRGDWGQVASNVNPLFAAPAEAFVIKKDLYTGAPLEGYEETMDKNPFLHLFNLLGGTETAGSGDEVVKKSYAHTARSLIPPWDFIERIADPTGRRTGRTDETLWRALGAPVYQLNDPLRETTRNRAYYEQRDRYQTQAELASM